MFNNYFFDKDSLSHFKEFLKSDKIIILMDPPFGGRVEPLAKTLNILNKEFIEANHITDDGE